MAPPRMPTVSRTAWGLNRETPTVCAIMVGNNYASVGSGRDRPDGPMVMPILGPTGIGIYAHVANCRIEVLTGAGCLEDLRHDQHSGRRRRSYGDPGEDVDREVDAEVDAGDDHEQPCRHESGGERRV
jgi:hypothetical protein